ncbi:hypothetical protein F5Y17DRAFT_427664 [Xylariaceae sp. FL0594]|nr:hypothetical protein F5Y17DRAFT_427664 [Xylariaceae sp. FL0594]
MHLHSLIAATAGLVATSSALLLTPDLPIIESATTLPAAVKADVDADADAVISQMPQTRTLALDCPGCLRFGLDRHSKFQKIIPSHLKLDFAIERRKGGGDDGAERLTVNGYELYPNPEPVAHTLVAPVLPDLADRHMGIPPRYRGGPNRPQRIQPLGFGMQTQNVAIKHDGEEEDLSLINIEIQIIEVGNVFNEDIPNVQVKLLKTPSGKLAIGAIDTIASRPVHSKVHKTCSTRLCRWKTLFFEKLSRYFSFKSCGGSSSSSKSGVPAPFRPLWEPAPHQPPRPHSPHAGEKHPAGAIMMAFISHVILPVLVGIVAGIFVGLLSLMLGSFIVYLWRGIFRRRTSSSHRCRHARKVASTTTAADDEKSGLMAHQEDPSEAPPAYMEGEVNVVAPVDEKKAAENNVV